MLLTAAGRTVNEATDRITQKTSRPPKTHSATMPFLPIIPARDVAADQIGHADPVHLW